jgi:hypothetical protein
LIRGKISRTEAGTMRKIMRTKKRYFLDEEFWETLSKTNLYSSKKPLISKEYEYTSSKAIYVG